MIEHAVRLAERPKRVGVKKVSTRLAIDCDALLERRARLVGPIQLRQRHAEAVEKKPFLTPVPGLADQIERSLVVAQRVRIRASIPLENPERVSQRRLPLLVAERGGQAERRFECRDCIGCRRRAFARRASDTFQCLELTPRVGKSLTQRARRSPRADRFGWCAPFEYGCGPAPHLGLGFTVFELTEELRGLAQAGHRLVEPPEAKEDFTERAQRLDEAHGMSGAAAELD